MFAILIHKILATKIMKTTKISWNEILKTASNGSSKYPNQIFVLFSRFIDRCKGDDEQRDWIHKEVACALNSKCNIIPVFDNFVMPDPQVRFFFKIFVK